MRNVMCAFAIINNDLMSLGQPFEVLDQGKNSGHKKKHGTRLKEGPGTSRLCYSLFASVKYLCGREWNDYVSYSQPVRSKDLVMQW